MLFCFVLIKDLRRILTRIVFMKWSNALWRKEK